MYYFVKGAWMEKEEVGAARIWAYSQALTEGTKGAGKLVLYSQWNYAATAGTPWDWPGLLQRR